MPDLYSIGESQPTLTEYRIDYTVALTIYHFREITGYSKRKYDGYSYLGNCLLEISTFYAQGLIHFSLRRPPYHIDDHGSQYGTAKDIEQIKVVIANAWREIKGV